MKNKKDSIILFPEQTPPLCMYCGNSIERTHGKGEHVIQKALGGTKTLRSRVCRKCNNNDLSTIDRELCSLSYLSIVASQEISGHLALVWDVDHQANNLLVEAQPIWTPENELKNLIAYPQITFERNGPHFRGDAEALIGFGRENLESVLKKTASNAFARLEKGERDSIQFVKCESKVLNDGYRLPPRIFAHRTIHQIARKIDKEKLYLHYANDDDKLFALDNLSKLHRQRPSQKFAVYQGSYTPSICFHFDIGRAVRGLLKMSLNLLASVCERTIISPITFTHVINLIRGIEPTTISRLQRNGFLEYSDTVSKMSAANKGHAFHITHDGQHWHIYSSFFGGRIGAYVDFRGPNQETWKTKLIMAPLKSNEWLYSDSKLIQCLNAKVELYNASKICPSVKLGATKADLTVKFEKRD